MKKAPRQRLAVNVEELDRIIDGALRAPVSASDGQKLTTALHAMAERRVRQRTTEKTSAVLQELQNSETGKKADGDGGEPEKPKGHGRNGAALFPGAQKVEVRRETLEPGDPCPECGAGKVYCRKEPRTVVRMVGQAPLKASVRDGALAM